MTEVRPFRRLLRLPIAKANRSRIISCCVKVDVRAVVDMTPVVDGNLMSYGNHEKTDQEIISCFLRITPEISSLLNDESETYFGTGPKCRVVSHLPKRIHADLPRSDGEATQSLPNVCTE